jgi:hypothetical protein
MSVVQGIDFVGYDDAQLLRLCGTCDVCGKPACHTRLTKDEAQRFTVPHRYCEGHCPEDHPQ